MNRVRHIREGRYPNSFKKNGFPSTTSGMTVHKYFCINDK